MSDNQDKKAEQTDTPRIDTKDPIQVLAYLIHSILGPFQESQLFEDYMEVDKLTQEEWGSMMETLGELVMTLSTPPRRKVVVYSKEGAIEAEVDLFGYTTSLIAPSDWEQGIRDIVERRQGYNHGVR